MQASYNPLRDLDGRVVKVIKFATDVTARVEAVECVADGLGRLARGDLAQRIDHAFDPSLDRLRKGFNASLDALETSMGAIGAGAQAIRAGTLEVSNATSDLSQRTTRQATNLEQTAAALEEITATVGKTAEAALQARATAGTAERPKDGARVMGDAVEAMKSIDKSSKLISQIIGVIDDIRSRPISSR